MYRGWFGVQSGTFHAGDQYHGRFSVNRVNHPRSGHESRKVRVSEVEPPTLRVCITDGSESKAEPSTLGTNIADGSMSQERTIHVLGLNRGRFGVQSGTFHAGSQYHGRFISQERTIHVLGLNHGWFGYQRVNRPRWGLISRMVQCQSGEPSTLKACIADGSESKAEPSTLRA